MEGLALYLQVKAQGSTVKRKGKEARRNACVRCLYTKGAQQGCPPDLQEFSRMGTEENVLHSSLANNKRTIYLPSSFPCPTDQFPSVEGALHPATSPGPLEATPDFLSGGLSAH
jgi:hypothetical protein